VSDAAASVIYGVEGRVARIILNRPDRLNASNRDLSLGLTAAFAQAAQDPQIRVILLSGAGRAFCAGADLRILDELSADPDAPNSGSGGLRYDGLMQLEKPVIAAIHGACAGIGLAMACSADIRLAAEDAVFVAPFAKLGLCAEGGLAWLMSRLMGRGHAAEMLLSARRIDAAEAYAKGLVSLVLPVEGFAQAAMDYASVLATGSPASFAMIKRQLAAADREGFDEARARAGELTQATLHAADFKEALVAKREGREAAFDPVSATFAPPISAAEVAGGGTDDE
jgi:enoyl-CoA hydratase/carnithine racemase